MVVTASVGLALKINGNVGMPTFARITYRTIAVLALWLFCASNSSASNLVNAWVVEQKGSYLTFTVYATGSAFSLVGTSGKLVAKAPKWDIVAFNDRERTCCKLPFRTWISQYPPERKFGKISQASVKTTIQGIPGLRYSFPIHHRDLTDAGSGLIFQSQLKQKYIRQRTFVFAADDHQLPEQAREIWRSFLEFSTENAIPLEVYDECSTGERSYVLRTVGQKQMQISPTMFDHPQNYKEVHSILTVFFAGGIDEAAELMGH